MNKISLLAFLMLGSGLAATPKDTLVFMVGSDVPTLDPGGSYDDASGTMVENLYETLVDYKGTSLRTVEPQLATGWTVGNGGKTYTFDIRRGVKFHSGAALTCRDAEYTFRRNLVSNNKNDGNWFLSESLLGTQDNAWTDKTITWARISSAVECNAAGQLVFRLPKADSTFLAKLAFYGNGIVERDYSARLGEWSGTERDWRDWVGKDLAETKLSRAPNGTGAYQFNRMDANNILLDAFPGYWGGKAPIAHVLRQRVTEQATRIAAFLKGDADFVEGGGRNVDEAQIKGKPGVAWLDNLPNVTAPTIMFNSLIRDKQLTGSGKLDGKGIPADFFNNVNVRKGFAYAFNYPEYTKALQGGQGKMRTMLMPDAFFGYDGSIKSYAYDPAQAAAYLKKAYNGALWQNGFTLAVNYRAGNVTAQTTFELLKKGIESLNPKFHITLQPKQWSDLITDSNKGMESLFLITWIPDYADPDNFLYSFYASDGFYAKVSNFHDEHMDVLLNQARSTTSLTDRSRWYSLLGKRAYDTTPTIILPAPVRYAFWRSNVSGLTANTYNPMRTFQAHVLFKELSKN